MIGTKKDIAEMLEWVELIKEAKAIGLTREQIRGFLTKSKTK